MSEESGEHPTSNFQLPTSNVGGGEAGLCAEDLRRVLDELAQVVGLLRAQRNPVYLRLTELGARLAGLIDELGGEQGAGGREQGGENIQHPTSNIQRPTSQIQRNAAGEELHCDAQGFIQVIRGAVADAERMVALHVAREIYHAPTAEAVLADVKNALAGALGPMPDGPTERREA